MRHIVTLLALLALVAAFVVDPPFAAAKKQDPGAAALAKLENAARKAAKGILRDTSKRIRARSGAVARRIKQLAKAVKKGKGLDTLTGVPFAAKRQEVTPAQLHAVFDLYTEALFEFQDGTTIDVESAFARLSADDAFGGLYAASSTQALVGGGGLVDEVGRDLRGAWGGGRAGLVRASRQLQEALRAHDFELTVAAFDPPRLVPLPLVGPQGDVLQAPALLEVLGSSDGDLVVVMPSRLPAVFHEFGTLIEARHVASGIVARVEPTTTSTAAQLVRFTEMRAGAIAVSSGVPLGKSLLPLATVGISVPPGGGVTTTTPSVITEPSVSLTVGGKTVGAAVFEFAVVQPAYGRIEAVSVRLEHEETGEPLFSVDVFSATGFVPTADEPFVVRIPAGSASQDRSSVRYYPSGSAGPVWGTFGTATSTLAMTFRGDPVAAPVDLILIGDVFLSTEQSPEETVPAHVEIRVPAKLVDPFF